MLSKLWRWLKIEKEVEKPKPFFCNIFFDYNKPPKIKRADILKPAHRLSSYKRCLRELRVENKKARGFYYKNNEEGC